MNLHRASPEASDASGRSRSAGGLLVAANVLLIPFTSPPVMRGNLTFIPYLIVAALAAVITVAVPNALLLLTRRPRNPALWLAVSIPGLMGVATLFHPSANAWFRVLFAVGAAALALLIWSMSRADIRSYVVIPLLIVASIESVTAVSQLVTRRALIPPWLATNVGPKVIDGVVRVQGTTNHVYVLSAIALLAIGSWAAVRRPHERTSYAVAIALGLSSAVISITYSRAALLALMLVLLVLAIESVRGDKALRLAILTVTGVCLFTIALTLPGWATRVEHSMASELDDAALGRMTLMGQAAALIASEPIVGVGPGRYRSVLEERGLADERFPWEVHIVPVAFAAENGIPAGLIMTVLLVWLGLAAIRAGPSAVAVYLAVLPALLFDVLHYVDPAGQLMLGIWLGVLGAAIRWTSADRREQP